MQLVDTHCHLDAIEREGGSAEAVIARAAAAGITRIVTIGTDLESSRRAAELAAAHEAVYAAVGIDPQSLGATGPEALDELGALAASPKVVAIGEIGLDYYRDRSPRDVQRGMFEALLALAGRLGLPVVIHDRDAHRDVEAILSAWAGEPASVAAPRGVLHCFSGDMALARRLARLGFMVSLAGNVTYPNAADLHDVARRLPQEALLLETDAPYLPPQSRRGKTNEPAWLRETAEWVAHRRQVPLRRVAYATARNAAHLFRW